MRVIEIAKIIDSWMPTSIAEDFDNVGLIIGDPESKITSILVTLDTTEDVVEEAINKGCNLIVSYHPINFDGLKQITNDNYVQKSVIKAVKNNIYKNKNLFRCLLRAFYNKVIFNLKSIYFIINKNKI